MDNERFVLNQTLSTIGAYGIEHFTVDGVHYMAIANHYDDGGYKEHSVIYKWSTGSKNNMNSPIYKWDGVKFTVF